MKLFIEIKNNREKENKSNTRNQSIDLRNAENLLIDTNESNNNNNFGFTSNSGNKSRNSSLINNTTSTSFKGISPRSGINITSQPTSPEMISYQNTSYSIKHNNIDNNPDENINENVHSDGNINNCDKEIPIYSMENNHINNIKKSLSNFETKTRKINSDITATGMKPRRKSLGSSGGKIFGGVAGIEDTYIENKKKEFT